MVCKIQKSDIMQIFKIEQDCFSQCWSEKSIEQSLDIENNIMLCAKIDNTVCGYIFADFVLDEVNLNRIAVHGDYRKNGIATELLNALFDNTADFASKIMLEVRKSNTAAISLYEKNGFKIDGIRKNFYQAPLEDAVLMTRLFKLTEVNRNNENSRY